MPFFGLMYFDITQPKFGAKASLGKEHSKRQAKKEVPIETPYHPIFFTKYVKREKEKVEININ